MDPLDILGLEAVVHRCSVKKVFLEILQNSQENTCIKNNFIKKETLAQVFSCENLSLQNTFGGCFCGVWRSNVIMIWRSLWYYFVSDWNSVSLIDIEWLFLAEIMFEVRSIITIPQYSHICFGKYNHIVVTIRKTIPYKFIFD